MMNLTRRAFVSIIGVASPLGYSYAANGVAPTMVIDPPRIGGKSARSTSTAGVVTPESLGAAGDGIADDTAAFQAALNSGASRIVCTAGATYLVRRAASKVVNLWPTDYCLTLPSNVELDLNGSTIKLADGANSCVIVAGGQGGTVTESSKLRNGVIDGNRKNQGYTAQSVMPCIYMQNCKNLVVDSVTIKEARDYCGFFITCVDSRFTNLSALGSDGQGWEFGTAARDQQLVNCFIDNIYAERCTGLRSNVQPGNPATFTLIDCAIGKAIGRNCGAGFKIQGNTRDVTVGQFIFDGSPVGPEPNYGTLNSGIKIQGSIVGGVTMMPQRVSIGAVISKNCAGSGLYIERSLDCSIENYHGKNNGSDAIATYGDVWLGGARCRIGLINSVGCLDPHHAVYARSYAAGCHLETIRVLNCKGCAVDIQCADIFTYGTIDAVDGGNMTLALRIGSPTCQGGGGIIRSSPPKHSAPRLAMNGKCHGFVIGPLIMSPADPLVGTVTLTNGATRTTVKNANCYRIRQGNGATTQFLQPLIEITPLSAEARAVGTVSVEFVDSNVGFGFIMHHSNPQSDHAAFQYRIVGWANV